MNKENELRALAQHIAQSVSKEFEAKLQAIQDAQNARESELKGVIQDMHKRIKVMTAQEEEDGYFLDDPQEIEQNNSKKGAEKKKAHIEALLGVIDHISDLKQFQGDLLGLDEGDEAHSKRETKHSKREIKKLTRILGHAIADGEALLRVASGNDPKFIESMEFAAKAPDPETRREVLRNKISKLDLDGLRDVSEGTKFNKALKSAQHNIKTMESDPMYKTLFPLYEMSRDQGNSKDLMSLGVRAYYEADEDKRDEALDKIDRFKIHGDKETLDTLSSALTDLLKVEEEPKSVMNAQEVASDPNAQNTTAQVTAKKIVAAQTQSQTSTDTHDEPTPTPATHSNRPAGSASRFGGSII